MRQLTAYALTLAVLAAPSAMSAQSMAAGTRVRVKGADLVVPVVGNIQSIRNDSLLVLEEGEKAQLWKFRTSEISEFEVSEGMGKYGASNMRRWGLIGAGIGGATSIIANVILNRNADPGFKYNYVKGFFIGAGIGGALGALYGGSKPIERWRGVPVPQRVGFAPTRQGVSLDLGYTF